jgi:hypothetical protein
MHTNKFPEHANICLMPNRYYSRGFAVLKGLYRWYYNYKPHIWGIYNLFALDILLSSRV